MRTTILAISVLLAATTAGARPVKAPATTPAGHCRLTGGEKLPVQSGGAAAVCAAIEKAVDAAAPKANYKIDVTVVRPWMLSATPVVNGRTLPAQKFAVNDAPLDAGAIGRFARSLAATVAKAAKA